MSAFNLYIFLQASEPYISRGSTILGSLLYTSVPCIMIWACPLLRFLTREVFICQTTPATINGYIPARKATPDSHGNPRFYARHPQAVFDVLSVLSARRYSIRIMFKDECMYPLKSSSPLSFTRSTKPESLPLPSVYSTRGSRDPGPSSPPQE